MVRLASDVAISCVLDFDVLPFQIIIHFIFLTLSLTTHLIEKFMQNIIFLLWLTLLLIKFIQEWLKFDYICTNFLNRMSGQV